MPLSNRAKKLILLLMDNGASGGERDTATRKLIECLRTSYPDGYALLEEWGDGKKTSVPPPKPSSVYGSFTMPFGQYKGLPIRDIPVDYLLYILDWPDLWPTTRKGIQRYLDSV
jgi:Putative quorum-sensing-regulated virulence factor